MSLSNLVLLNLMPPATPPNPNVRNEQNTERDEKMDTQASNMMCSNPISPITYPCVTPPEPILKQVSIATVVRCINQTAGNPEGSKTPHADEVKSDDATPADPFLSSAETLKKLLFSLEGKTSKSDDPRALIDDIIKVLKTREAQAITREDPAITASPEDAMSNDYIKNLITAVINFVTFRCESEPVKKAFKYLKSHMIAKVEGTPHKNIENHSTLIHHLILLMTYYKLLRSVAPEKRNELLQLYPIQEETFVECVNGLSSSLKSEIDKIDTIFSAALQPIIGRFTQQVLPWVESYLQKHTPSFCQFLLGITEINDVHDLTPIPNIPPNIAWNFLFSQENQNIVYEIISKQLSKLQKGCKVYDERLAKYNSLKNTGQNSEAIKQAENDVELAEKNVFNLANEFGINNPVSYCYDEYLIARAFINDKLIDDIVKKLKDTNAQKTPIIIPTFEELYKNPDAVCRQIAEWHGSLDINEYKASIKMLWILHKNFRGSSFCMAINIFGLFKKFESTKNASEIEILLKQAGPQYQDMYNFITINIKDKVWIDGEHNHPDIDPYYYFKFDNNKFKTLNPEQCYMLLLYMIKHGAPVKEINALLDEKGTVIKSFKQSHLLDLSITLSELCEHYEFDTLPDGLENYLVFAAEIVSDIKRMPERMVLGVISAMEKYHLIIGDNEDICELLINFIDISREQNYEKALEAIYELCNSKNIFDEIMTADIELISIDFKRILDNAIIAPRISPKVLFFLLAMSLLTEYDALDHTICNLLKDKISEGKVTRLTDSSGNTLLHISSKKANEVFVKALMKLGANPETRNNAKETPLDLAHSPLVTKALNKSNYPSTSSSKRLKIGGSKRQKRD
ncbi:MAG: hypothetical protein HRT90_05810 [Candidatus Margulisbacteria bacterium]|nr:hypothetical protein [Candidatus Margulisiibacteriota bacterium]